ncbi:hypothetical protein ACQP00_32030 [Dactylosporangium sp. CS-047395]
MFNRRFLFQRDDPGGDSSGFSARSVLIVLGLVAALICIGWLLNGR